MRRIWLSSIAVLIMAVIGLALWAAGADAGSDPGYAGSTSNLEASAKTAACSGPPAAPCSLVSYSILLANAGGSLPRVSVLDSLPLGVQYVPGSAQGGLQYDGDLNAMTWIGSLPAKSAVPLTFTVRSMVTAPMTVTNAALICSDTPGSVCITRSVDIRIEAPARPTPTATPTAPAETLDCSNALTMSLDTRYHAGATRLSAANVLSYSCAAGWIESGPEVVYALDIDRPVSALTITLQAASQDLDLFILDDCDPAACVTAGDRIVALDQPADFYYVVVDGRYGALGDYILELTWAPAEPATPTTTPTGNPTGEITPSATPTATRTPRPTATPTASATPTRLYRRALPLILFRYPRPAAATATPTPSYPVGLDAAWIEGPKSTVNYNFRPCEVVYEYLRVRNYAKTEAHIRVDWIATDMSGRELPNLTYRNAGPFALPGEHQADIALPGVLPPDAPLGSYTLLIRLSGSAGVIAERTLYFSVSGEDPQSLPLAELALCRNIVDGLPADIAPNDTFLATDDTAYAWTWWQRVGSNEAHTVVWAWYRPDGQLYTLYEDSFEGDCTAFAWGWMDIADSPAAAWPGMWRLEIWLDGRPVTSRPFQIVAANGASTPIQGPITAGGGHLSNPCLDGVCPPPAPR